MLTFAFIVIIVHNLIEEEFDDPWRATLLSIVGLFLVWYFVVVCQQNIDESDAAKQAEKDAYYNKCITETEIIVNNVSVSHIKTNKCIP